MLIYAGSFLHSSVRPAGGASSQLQSNHFPSHISTFLQSPLLVIFEEPGRKKKSESSKREFCHAGLCVDKRNSSMPLLAHGGGVGTQNQPGNIRSSHISLRENPVSERRGKHTAGGRANVTS